MPIADIDQPSAFCIVFALVGNMAFGLLDLNDISSDYGNSDSSFTYLLEIPQGLVEEIITWINYLAHIMCRCRSSVDGKKRKSANLKE